MLDVAKPDNVKSVTDPHRPKDFLDQTEIKSFLDVAKAGRQALTTGGMLGMPVAAPRIAHRRISNYRPLLSERRHRSDPRWAPPL